MNDNGSEIQEAPFVITFWFSGAMQNFKFSFPDEFFYVPLQPKEMSIACHRGNYKKVRPEIQRPHVHDQHINAAMILKKLSQLQSQLTV
jgi:hypothetical protein